MSHTVTEPSDRSCPHIDSYNPAAAEEIIDPFTTWAAARMETPIFYSPVLNTYVVMRYEDISEVLMDPETFSSRVMLEPLKERPREVEEILATGFDPGRLRGDGDARRTRNTPRSAERRRQRSPHGGWPHLKTRCDPRPTNSSTR